MKFAAVILDLDGTIIKSEKEWSQAFISVFKTLGVKSDGSDPHTRGVATKTNWMNILAKYNIKTSKTLEELETLTYLEYQKLIPNVTLNDGVLEFMDTIYEAGIPLALATSSSWETTAKVLEEFSLTEYFQNISTEEEVLNEKPAPDIYLLASEKLGIDPVDCLVIEDSPSGVSSAKEAGMSVIGISEDEEDGDKLSEADLVVEGFSEITLKAIDAIGID